jgi:hydrogenase expression/formation protein HypD
MKEDVQTYAFQNAFRANDDVTQALVHLITKDANVLWNRLEEPIKIMTFCGTHEWTVTRYGLRSLLPPCVELVPGPGCPVCVTPSSQVEQLVKLAMEGVIVYSYGDGFRLPTARTRKTDARSLQDAKAKGADVRVVYSFLDAVKDAKEHGRRAVFFGMGFETITPSYSTLFKKGLVPLNLSFLSAVKLTPPAMKYVIEIYADRGLLPLSGIIAPGHVSAILGAKVWDFLPRDYNLPTVVSGFEPLDVLYSVAEILKMVRHSSPRLFNEYQRLVTWNGNIGAKAANSKVMEEVMAGWRGIGPIPQSGYDLRQEFGTMFDAVKNHGLVSAMNGESSQGTNVSFESELPPGCKCGEVVIGAAKPNECPMFMKGCTPENAWGPCMVSAEGTCRVWAVDGGLKTANSLVAQEKGGMS